MYFFVLFVVKSWPFGDFDLPTLILCKIIANSELRKEVVRKLSKRNKFRDGDGLIYYRKLSVKMFEIIYSTRINFHPSMIILLLIIIIIIIIFVVAIIIIIIIIIIISLFCFTMEIS